MAKTKKIKYKQADGTLSDYIAIGADAKNIDLEEGISLEALNQKIVRYDPMNPYWLKTMNEEIFYPATRVSYIYDENRMQSLTNTLNDLSFQYKNTVDFPKASEENVGRVIQYVGDTLDNHYTKGCFFKCVIEL